MSTQWRLVLCFAVFATALGCSSSSARSGPGPSSTTTTWETARAPDLAGRSYLLTDAIVAGAPTEIVAQRAPTLSFRADGSFFAENGCNGSGPYAITTGIVTSTDSVSTLIGCMGPVLDQTKWFDGVLVGRPAAVVSGDKLALTRGQDRLTFSLEPRP